MHETSWPKCAQQYRLATNWRVENCVCVLGTRLVTLIAVFQSSVKWRPCFPVSDARRTGQPRRAIDWSEHFSPEAPAAATEPAGIFITSHCPDKWGWGSGRGVYRNWGDRALRGGGTQLDRGTGNGSQLGRPRGRRGLINGSCFGPNTQLGDLTKCSVSSPPLFFLARHNVCPHLTEREVEQGGKSDRAQGQRGCFWALRLSIKQKEMRGCQEWICFLYDRGFNYPSFLAMMIFYSPT